MQVNRSGTRVSLMLYQCLYKSGEQTMKGAETGRLRQGGCFRVGHFSPKGGGNCPKRRSGVEQTGYGVECLGSAFCPISVQYFNGLCVMFKPVERLIEKCLALTQSGLATLAVVSPFDVFRRQQQVQVVMPGQ